MTALSPVNIDQKRAASKPRNDPKKGTSRARMKPSTHVRALISVQTIQPRVVEL